MDRRPGLSVRLKLTLSYTGFVMVAGALLLGAVWLFLLGDMPRLPLRAALQDVLNPTVLVGGRGPRVFVPVAVAVMGFLLLFGLVGGWFLAGRMLSPLTRITEATRTAAAGSLSHRIGLPGRDDEFRELADAFDAMLARLEAHVAEQRRFAANASHELRTPLATTQALLEVARQDPGQSLRELVDRLTAVNTRAIDLTEALLLLSRAEQGSSGHEPVDLSLLAEEAAETLLPLAEARGTTIEVSGDVATTLGSPTLLLQLTTNLVHNAIVHNLPDGGSVRVTTGARGSDVTLTVENTGDVLDPGQVARLAEPFQRGADRVRTGHDGVGLGLAIVRSIAVAHGGTLTLVARPVGGLRATVRLPRSAASSRYDR